MSQDSTHHGDSMLSDEDLIATAREEFATFAELVFPVLHSGQAMIHAAYIDLIAAVLHGCEKGKRPRVLINMPPGFLKSMLVSILYVAWRLGRDPSARFICISYGDDLAHYLSSRTRDLMLSPLYRRIFPGTILTKKAENLLTTTQGGHRYATAVGSDITGFRADEIIIDDPLQPADAYSGLKKDAVITWLQNSVLSRFKDPSRGVLILVMHSLAPDDPAGQLEEGGNYFVLKLPLVAEKRERFSYKDRILFERQPGELLNSHRMTPEDVENLKLELSPHIFDAQYQQRPALGGSGMCNISRLVRYAEPPPFELIIHSWDIAGTLNGNYTVCTTWGAAKLPEIGDALYLIDVMRIRAEIPDVREAIKARDRLDEPDLIILDGCGIGLGIYQDLRRNGYPHVCFAGAIPDNSQSKPKIERFNRILLPMYDGIVRFPETAPYLDSILAELAAFPGGKYDDQVDSITQIVVNMPNVLQKARLRRRKRRSKIRQ